MRDKLLAVFCCSLFAIAQDVQQDTIAKPLTAKEKKKRDKKLAKELESPFHIWETVDVAYIISDAERKALHDLSNDDERQSFVEQFWLRRNPTPETEENEFKEEHYRRIAYANERFASGVPGWKTDRGRIYIVFGPPDEIDTHPSGGSYQQTPQEGGGQITTFPFERWRYRYLEGIGTNIAIEFVDPSMTGEYRLTIDPTEKNALLHTPAGQQQLQTNPLVQRDEFAELELLANLGRAPGMQRYKDLEAMVSTNIRYNTLPMQVRTDFIPVTPASILAYVTVQFDTKDLAFANVDGRSHAGVNLYARISTISRRPVNVFEEAIAVDEPNSGKALYQKTIPLAPGRYRLNIAAKDVTGGNTAAYEAALDVPEFFEDRLAASSLILADQMEPVPVRGTGGGPFVIGATKVRPRVDATFRRDEKLGVYIHLYHFDVDAGTHKPRGTIQYQVVRNGTSEILADYTEDVAALEAASEQAVIKKWLPLGGFAAGAYTLRLTVTDENHAQSIHPSALFIVSDR